MNFARLGTLAVLEWKDTKVITLASTIHNTEKDFEPQPFEYVQLHQARFLS